MNRRRLLAVSLVILLGLNSLSGLARIIGSAHRILGERALQEAELDSALKHLVAATFWQAGDSPTWILIGRVVQHAQANGLPLESLEGHQPVEVFGVGVAAMARGIALNPADSWGWFNLGNLYQGYRSARVRLDRMRRAGEASGTQPPPAAEIAEGAEDDGLGPEDVVSAAATLKAVETAPDFYLYHDFLAKLYWGRGLEKEALDEAVRSFELTPQVAAHGILATAGLAKTLAPACLEGIDRAASNPFAGPLVAARARADLLEMLGRVPEAIAAFERLRDLGGAGVAAECDLKVGKLEAERGAYQESIRLLTRALDAGRGTGMEATVLYQLGWAQARLGNHVEAEKNLRAFLEKQPDEVIGYLDLAQEREELGRTEEAERLYVAAVRRFPTNPATYQRLIAHLRQHGKPGQALAYAQGLRKVDPGDGDTETLIRTLEEEAAGKAP